MRVKEQALPPKGGSHEKMFLGRQSSKTVACGFDAVSRRVASGFDAISRRVASAFRRKALVAITLSFMTAVALTAQGRVTTEKLLKPGTDSWPTFNGDYTGRRFSALTRITSANVHQLSLAWMYRVATGTAGTTIKSTPLMVDGVLYFSVPDHVWAVDARTGREIWH